RIPVARLHAIAVWLQGVVPARLAGLEAARRGGARALLLRRALSRRRVPVPLVSSRDLRADSASIPRALRARGDYRQGQLPRLFARGGSAPGRARSAGSSGRTSAPLAARGQGRV